MNIRDRIVNSAIWAAYGDALGFISELGDALILKKRTGLNSLTGLINWRRRIGGQYGPDVPLPAGCYSDDTQLRLATGRAIRADGTFDVEVFAKIELTVWPSYALGAGRGTKAAAAGLARQDTNWFSNFFSSNKSEYMNCGGNGAAMRIQPHVWASLNRGRPKCYLGDVIRNSICSHGHFRGIVGAVFHALCLALALEKETEPGPEMWKEAVNFFNLVAKVMRDDTNICTFWLPTWEQKSGMTIEHAIKDVSAECLDDIEVLNGLLDMKPQRAYLAALDRMGGKKKDMMGSGTKTAIFASFLAWLYRDESPDEAMLLASNSLGSDTDTIATMAGAIMGACKATSPVTKIMDSDYIASEAERLCNISAGLIAEEFSYPDLHRWIPPKTQLDVVGLHGNKIAVAGLGIATAYGDEFSPPARKSETVWQWLSLSFGQSILSKRRVHIRGLPLGNIPTQGYLPSLKVHNPDYKSGKFKSEYVIPLDIPLEGAHQDKPRLGCPGNPRIEQHNLLQFNPQTGASDNDRESDVDLLTKQAIDSGFNEGTIGNHILNLSRREGGVNQAIGYAAIIAKAIAARQRQKRN